jgi:hypothetical protein
MGGSARGTAPFPSGGAVVASAERPAPERSAWRLFRLEQATLGRLGRLIRAEMAELAPDSWAVWRLDSALSGDGWGDLVLPELAALLRAADPPGGRARRGSAPCPSTQDRAALRRLGELMRTEASELAAWGSQLARRLDCWGIRLVLDCDRPQRPCPSLGRAPPSRSTERGLIASAVSNREDER